MLQNEEFVRTITARIEEAKGRPTRELDHRHIIVLIGGVRYAIPMGIVLEVVRTPALTPIPGARSYVQGIFFHRGAVIPVIDIPKRFGSGGVALRVPEHVVIVKEGSASYGFLVDRVVDAIECPPESMHPIVATTEAHLPISYLVGRWEHSIPSDTPLFKYDFLIAGPSLKEQIPEEGVRTVPLETYLLSIRHMVEALENDAFSAVIQ